MSPLFRNAVRYGLIAGALSFVLLIGLYYLGRHPLMIAPFLDFRILLLGVFIFFCMKEVRDYYQQGELYFWQGMTGGGVLVLIANTIGALGLMLFGKIEKDFVSSYITLMTAYLKTFSKEDIERIGKTVFDSNISQLPATNVSVLAATYFAQGLAIGFFVTIIVSVIVRRQQQPKI
jgi:hypothetical protein